jgi:peptidoglycan/LPS O-acetylase OafA/YrhL
VRETRTKRALLALICVALLVLCTAIVPAAAHVDLAIPVLAFCFLVVLAPSLLRLSDGRPAAQPISFLTLHISRAPPVA